MTSFARRRLLSVTGAITTASFLGALRPVRVARAAEGAPAWSIKGLYMAACPCEAICPCDFGNAPTYGSCTALIGFHIESGRQGDVTLDGLNVVDMASSPGHMGKGNWQVAIYVDERATQPQREALSAIFSFKPGGVFAKNAGLVVKDHGVKFVPITFEAQGRQRKMVLAGIGDADVTAVPGRDDKEIMLENLPGLVSPRVVAKSTHAGYKDHDLQLDVSGRHGSYALFALNSA